MSSSEHVGNARRARHGWRLVPVLLAVAGVLVASNMVWKASKAAFSATTSNGTNTFATGTVSLTDNDSNAVLYNVNGLGPGDTGTQCIRVTYTGSLRSAVKLYGSGETATNSLDTFITFQIEEGTNASVPAFGSCTGFVSGSSIFNATMNTLPTTYGSAVGSWAPTAANQTKDYRFTYTISNSLSNTGQSATASVSFVWEAQNF